MVYESTRLASDGRRIPVEISSSLSEVNGELLVLSISRDITGRKKKERHLEELTLHDELTGLFNRRGFYVMLPEQGKRAKRAGAAVSSSTAMSMASRPSTIARGTRGATRCCRQWRPRCAAPFATPT